MMFTLNLHTDGAHGSLLNIDVGSKKSKKGIKQESM